MRVKWVWLVCCIALLGVAQGAVPNADAYVTRGLVAHWDAIDNAGIGVHDGAATTWIDLTGNGFDWTLDMRKVSWNADRLSFNASGDGEGVVPGTSARKPTDFDGKITTIECIYKADDIRYSNIFCPGYDNREAGITTVGTGYMAFWDNSKQNMWGVPMDTAVHAYTALYNRPGTARPTGLALVYLDGVPVTPTQAGNWLGQVATVSLGARETLWTKPAKGYLQSIRIYSVKLTPEEVAYNRALDQVRFFGRSAAEVVPPGYRVDANGGFVRKPSSAARSAFDDVKVWYKGAAGNAVDTEDTGGADGWSNAGLFKGRSLPTANVGGGDFDGGSYRWWGWRMKYGTDHVRLPYANVDLGETPCLIFPGAGEVRTNGFVDVEIQGEVMNRPVIRRKVGSFRLSNLLSDWPSDKVCSNYTCVVRFKAGEPINPVPTGNNVMKLLSFGSEWTKGETGLAIGAIVTDYFSHRYRLRWTVGDSFAYQNEMEFDQDRWVDLAVVVESPKMTLFMCCEDGPEGAVTNKFSEFTKTFSAGNNPRPAIAPNRRVFKLGSAGDAATYDTFTNGFNGAGLAMDFQGSMHQFAFWDRALSMQEVREAMGRPALVKVGLEGGAGNAEFTARKTTVAAEGDWENLNPVLTAANPAATITFRCSRQWHGLPQFLRVAACSDSDAGTLAVTLNGTALGPIEVKPGAATHVFIPAGRIAEGENTLTLTRSTGSTLKLDAVTVNGSWQYGIDAKSQGVGCFSYASEHWDARNLVPNCGDDKGHYRGLDKSNPYVCHFHVPEDLVGACKGTFHVRVQNSGGVTRTCDIKVNDVLLATSTLRGNSSTDVATVRVPPDAFHAGWNTVSFSLRSDWANMDCFKFTLEPYFGTTYIIFR